MPKQELPLCFHSPWRKHCVSEALYSECSRGLAHPDFARRACLYSAIPVGPGGIDFASCSEAHLLRCNR